jgi:hypothetical protein
MITDQFITTIAALSDLVESKFKDNKATTILYRGHGAASFVLRPKAGRHHPPENSSSKEVNEKLMLELFRRQSVDRISIADVDDWELLAIAQHHGLATRLLDWTRSPLVALYFAVRCECETRSKEKDSEGRPMREDAEIIAWRCPKIDLTQPLPKKGPFAIDKTIRYVPRIVTPRLRAQRGVFTVHPKPREEFKPEEGGCVHMRIPYEARRQLKNSLFRHGIHEEVLFPDLDGLARHIQWCQTKCY